MAVITLETIDGFFSCFSRVSRHEAEALSFSLKMDAASFVEIDALELVVGWCFGVLEDMILLTVLVDEHIDLMLGVGWHEAGRERLRVLRVFCVYVG